MLSQHLAGAPVSLLRIALSMQFGLGAAEVFEGLIPPPVGGKPAQQRDQEARQQGDQGLKHFP